jgi:RNA polymerase sigma factor (sigma-70 family)
MACNSSEPSLFPELVEQAKDAGPNSLSGAERHKLVESVIGWCRKLARDFAAARRLAGQRLEVDDIESEAFVAAAEAACYFDPRRGIQFTTYVRAWVDRHLIAVADPRYRIEAAAMEFPERVASRDDGPEEIDPPGPDADARRILGSLAEPARTIVRLSVFDRLSPGRIAAQLGMPLKDVRLHLRNSAAKLNHGSSNDAGFAAMMAAAGNGSPADYRGNVSRDTRGVPANGKPILDDASPWQESAIRGLEDAVGGE